MTDGNRGNNIFDWRYSGYSFENQGAFIEEYFMNMDDSNERMLERSLKTAKPFSNIHIEYHPDTDSMSAYVSSVAIFRISNLKINSDRNRGYIGIQDQLVKPFAPFQRILIDKYITFK